jgi:uncharacterized protein (UPF0335 family)
MTEPDTQPIYEDRRKPQPLLRVTEVDPKRLERLEADVDALKQQSAARDERIKNLTTNIDSTLSKLDNLDEVLRGNGKEGLSSIVRRLESKMDDFPEMIRNQVELAIERIERNLNTNKMKTITREQIKAYNEEEGSWYDFKKEWVRPLMMIVLSAIIGGLISHYLFP